jgi:flagellar biosynthesis/type III secretory pathway chaperone
MKNSWDPVVECLRNEATEYGRLLQLIEEQQQTIFKRDTAGVLRLTNAIQGQADVLQDCRRRRDRVIGQFAADNGRDATASLRSMLADVAPESRPQLEALIGEVNRLIHRVRRSMHLNRRLLGCTLEFHQELLRRLRPDSFTKTYARDGRVSVTAPRPMPTIQTAG